jgi:hypothetical protein
MYKYYKFITPIFLLLILCYVAGIFNNANFNITEWTEKSRNLLSETFILISLIIILGIYIKNLNKY